MDILVASSNLHKINEMKEILKDSDINLLSLKDVGLDNIDIIENGKSYKENSLIKAKEISKYTNLPIIADDSGLEISFLGFKKPGIYTKRYAVYHGGQDKTNKYLSQKACKSLRKSAKFTCVITLYNYKNNKPLFFKGVMKGKISTYIGGVNGFGYDPIFIPKGYSKTTAELESNIKNSISHRYRALKKLSDFIKNN